MNAICSRAQLFFSLEDGLMLAIVNSSLVVCDFILWLHNAMLIFN